MTQKTTKICTGCKEEKELSSYRVKSSAKDGRDSRCKSCLNSKYEKSYYATHKGYIAKVREQYREKTRNCEEHIKRRMLWRAKKRAKLKNREFNLTIEDLPDKLPEYCPVLPHIKLESTKNRQSDASYSLDRIDSTKGYVPGNIKIISLRANLLKNDATLEEIKLILKYLAENQKETSTLLEQGE